MLFLGLEDKDVFNFFIFITCLPLLSGGYCRVTGCVGLAERICVGKNIWMCICETARNKLMQFIDELIA